MRNQEVARLLEDIAAALELKGDSPFRYRSYQDAARTIANMGEDVTALQRTGHLTDIPGVGASIAETIATYLATGRSPYLEGLIREIPPGAFELMRLPGIGPRKAERLLKELHVASLSELAAAARAHRIRGLPGMGAKTEENILAELDRLERRSLRLPLHVAWPLADEVAARLRASSTVTQVEPAGSIRRRRETIGDIDLLVASTDPDGVARAIAALDLTKQILARGPTKISFLTHDDFQIDVRIVPPETWGAALQYFTGSKAHNIALRERAIRLGYKVSEYGVFREADGRRVAGRTEEEVYARLGLPWIPPELRENAGELEAAAQGTLPRLVTIEDLQGDCHAHTTSSDGHNTLAEMVAGAIACGYRFIIITDHSYGLGVAQGLTLEKAESQWAAIRDLNRQVAPFRVLAGVELEIRASGALDFPDEVLRRFDVVSASIHTGTKQAPDQLTRRMVGALRNPYVTLINHPSGRVVGHRPGYEFDLARVLTEAKRHGKALEINGSARMDLSDQAARQARERGVKVSLGSDAHSVGGLAAMRFAVAIARRAWLGPHDILNCRTPEALIDYIASQRDHRSKPG